MPAPPASLAEALHHVGWNPRQLAVAINAWLVERGKSHLRIDPTAPYSWRSKGFCPRPPIPAVAATVLSAELGYPVTVGQLWPGRAAAGPFAVSAADGLDGYVTLDDVTAALNDLTVSSHAGGDEIVGATG